MKLRNKKTGEYGRFIMCHDGKIPFYIEAIAGSRLYYHNFGEMLEVGWDVCITPQEPLIKDEKIRKALRVWADENRIKKVGFKLDMGNTLCACYFMMNHAKCASLV